eukprot:scaffold16704_cov112-Isochrysis_galbana.AAC.2
MAASSVKGQYYCTGSWGWPTPPPQREMCLGVSGVISTTDTRTLPVVPRPPARDRGSGGYKMEAVDGGYKI